MQPSIENSQPQQAAGEGLNVHWKELFTSSQPFSLLAALQPPTTTTTTTTAAVDVIVAPSVQPSLKKARIEQVKEPTVNLLAFAADRARYQATCAGASFFVASVDEAQKYWEENRSFYTHDYKQRHKSAMKRINRLLRVGK